MVVVSAAEPQHASDLADFCSPAHYNKHDQNINNNNNNNNALQANQRRSNVFN